MQVALPFLFQTRTDDIRFVFQLIRKALAPFVWQPRGCMCACVVFAFVVSSCDIPLSSCFSLMIIFAICFD